MTASTIEIRRATADDLPEVARLAGMLVRMHHQADPWRFLLVDDVEGGYRWWLAQEIERAQVVILVAARDAEIVGYAYGTLEGRDWNALLDDHGAIHDIFVAESERKRGVGKWILMSMIAELEALGARRLVLSTMVTNEAAQRLFMAHGFRATMIEMTRGGELPRSSDG